MTREEIIALARKAGIAKHGLGWTCWEGQLERFASLVEERTHTNNKARWYQEGVEAEREACAVACDDIEVDRWSLFKGRAPYTGQEDGRASSYVQGESDGAGKCAAAIRARGNT